MINLQLISNIIRNLILVSIIVSVCIGCTSSTSPPHSTKALPPHNPYLAQVYNNQGHWNDAGTDSTVLTVLRGHYKVTPESYVVVPNDALGIPAYTAEVAGKRVHWFFAGNSMRKLYWTGNAFVEIDRLDIPSPFPDYTPISAKDRLQQAKDIDLLLQAGDEYALADYLKATPNRLLSAVEDQVNAGVLYSLFTRDHTLIGSNARGLLKLANIDPRDPFSKLAEPVIHRLPHDLFDDSRVARQTIFPKDVVFGLGMTFNGYLVINTIGGKIVTLNRDTFDIIDIYQVSGPNEVFTNSFALSHEVNGGAIYVASNRKMYRFVVNKDGKIQDAPELGAWQVKYDSGVRLPYGKISDGTGATPTLMGFGEQDDKLVVLTDGSENMQLVAFWRDSIPKDARVPKGTMSPRIADLVKVDMGADTKWVQSEQSVVAHDGYAFLVNGVPPKKAAPYPVRGSYFRGLLLGTTRKPPSGTAMYKWDNNTHRWVHRWTRPDIAVLATVPFITSGSHMVVVNGYFADRQRELYHLGLDLDNGKTVMSISSGTDPLFNGTFTGVKTDHDGTLMYTTMFGLVRFDVEKMERVSKPD